MPQILYTNSRTGKTQDITTLVSAASWKTKRVGSPAQLDLTLVPDHNVKIVEGGRIALSESESGLFLGYVFKITRNEKEETSLTAYDQIRYLKNKDTYVFQGQRADQITAQIAADFGVRVGALANTGYVIPQMVEDSQTLLDIILKALDLTLINTGQMFYLWDDFGALRISNIAASAIGLMVGDESLATAYTYSSDIDSDTANKIKLVRDNKETSKRDVYIVQDSNNMAAWGVLQHYEKVSEELNPAQIVAMADNLLELKNRPKKSFDISGLSDLSIRAGRNIKIQISKIGINGWYIIDEATHDLVKETMTLKVVIV